MMMSNQQTQPKGQSANNGNNAFKALNSQIKQEAHELDWTRTKGHRLGDAYTNRKVLTREEAISKLLGENDKEKKKDNKEDKKNGSGK